MKNIEVSEEMYNKLIELATEMTTQDPRATRMPHMFQIRDWKRVYDFNLNGDVSFWMDRTGDPREIESLEDLLDYLNEMDIEHDPDEIEQLWMLRDVNYDTDLNDWIEENCPELEPCTYSMEPVYVNCFLTAKSAQEHLDSNYYHYHKNADVYLNHAWRNPEMDTISEFLCSLVGKKPHS